MVKLGGILVCVLIVAMDVSAGILGIKAEVEQNKVKHLRLWIFECRDPSHAAFKLAFGAAALLSLAHVLANLGGISDWTVDAGNRDAFKQQIEGIVWFHAPSFPFDWRNWVFRSCAVFCCILRYCYQ
ncbi:hypothetical protein COLO4_13023 [Corchorus olitorius]|uniref:Uncharacterized protein n=1 Tax=Corchorus olitorius TaxID=93759 RepID=A0A1R3JYK7_9ROSI|nr:hypothetical protein COLO4_13023 [Corchorus olitorius]